MDLNTHISEVNLFIYNKLNLITQQQNLGNYFRIVSEKSRILKHNLDNLNNFIKYRVIKKEGDDNPLINETKYVPPTEHVDMQKFIFKSKYEIEKK